MRDIALLWVAAVPKALLLHSFGCRAGCGRPGCGLEEIAALLANGNGAADGLQLGVGKSVTACGHSITTTKPDDARHDGDRRQPPRLSRRPYGAGGSTPLRDTRHWRDGVSA
jgi:hypothetical protein